MAKREAPREPDPSPPPTDGQLAAVDGASGRTVTATRKGSRTRPDRHKQIPTDAVDAQPVAGEAESERELKGRKYAEATARGERLRLEVWTIAGLKKYPAWHLAAEEGSAEDPLDTLPGGWRRIPGAARIPLSDAEHERMRRAMQGAGERFHNVNAASVDETVALCLKYLRRERDALGIKVRDGVMVRRDADTGDYRPLDLRSLRVAVEKLVVFVRDERWVIPYEHPETHGVRSRRVPIMLPARCPTPVLERILDPFETKHGDYFEPIASARHPLALAIYGVVRVIPEAASGEGAEFNSTAMLAAIKGLNGGRVPEGIRDGRVWFGRDVRDKVVVADLKSLGVEYVPGPNRSLLYTYDRALNRNPPTVTTPIPSTPSPKRERTSGSADGGDGKSKG